MKYEFIKRHKLSHKVIAKAFGYKNIESFRRSTAQPRIMSGIDTILEITEKES